jgi:integrase
VIQKEIPLGEIYPILTAAKQSTLKNQLLFEGYSVERIGKCFRRILIELKIDKNKGYNLKTFRKSFASELAEKGLSDGDIADLLGHASTSTTRKYYKRKNVNALRDRMNRL